MPVEGPALHNAASEKSQVLSQRHFNGVYGPAQGIAAAESGSNAVHPKQAGAHPVQVRIVPKSMPSAFFTHGVQDNLTRSVLLACAAAQQS